MKVFSVVNFNSKRLNINFEHILGNLFLTDGSTMGGPLSVIFSDIYMTKTELEVVNPSKPKFYKRFVDIINRRNKNQPDDLFQKLNSNHPNVKYTVEVKPEVFLDTKIVYSNDVITTEV